jgi:hypothetical protein
MLDGLQRKAYFVFNHMLNLSFHGNNKENTEVQDEDGIIHTNKSTDCRNLGTYGTSKKENHVQTKAMVVARVAECQNLNSGNLTVS